MKSKIKIAKGILILLGWSSSFNGFSQSITIDATTGGRKQVIDGFGTGLGGTNGEKPWFQDLYYNDAMCSILRMGLVTEFVSPYSDYRVNSPWFHNNPALPGPENNNVRTYNDATDYTRSFGGRNAKIAVMGPDINKNILLFDFNSDLSRVAIAMAKAGQAQKAALGDFKFMGSVWSPAPWLKISSGNTINGQAGILPVNGTKFPFIWNGNYAGGELDVSNTPLAVFNDGVQNTSALTQFARSTAAYVKGIQDKTGVGFYAISIQNELNFETYYYSAYYPLSSQYISALKAVRQEFDKYPELKSVKIMGPEDLLGAGSYSMWQYGAGTGAIHKNLQYLTEIGKDPAALAAIDYFCIHGYAADGISSGGANPIAWDWWANGWVNSPDPGIPANVKGFKAYNKKSWMTETSGEHPEWLSPATGFPSDGAFSVALRIHEALTTGQESAWVYWQLSDDNPNSDFSLTDETKMGTSPKYNAFKHYSKYIRPNSFRLNSIINGASNIKVSSYIHDANKTLSLVIINSNSTQQTITVNVPALPFTLSSFDSYTSSDNNFWQSKVLPVNVGKVSVTIPAFGVVTLNGQGTSVTALEALTQNADAELTVYPNPFLQEISFKFNTQIASKMVLKVTDMKGNTVYQSDKYETNQEIKLGKQLTPGTYIISATDAQGLYKSVKVDKY